MCHVGATLTTYLHPGTERSSGSALLRFEPLQAHQRDTSIREGLDHPVEMCLIDDVHEQDAVGPLGFDDGSLEWAGWARAEAPLDHDPVGDGR